MKLTILQENLLSTLKDVFPFVPSSPQLPLLENILLEAKKNEILINATDLSLGIRKRTRAKVEKEGSCCIKAKSLLSFISQLAPGKTEMTVENGTMQISSGATQAKINTADTEGFPTPKEAKKEKGEIRREMISQIAEEVAFAAAQDETRVVLTGVKIEKAGEKERAVATDGFRLSVKELEEKILGKEEEMIMPARLFAEISRIAGEEKKLQMSRDKGGTLIVSWKDTLLNAQLIEGKFPDFERIIPDKFTTRAVFDKEEGERLIKTAAVFARESANIIRLSITKKGIEISANAPQVGSNKSVLSAQVDGEENKAAFNHRFLLDFLRSAKGEEIIFEMTEPLKPGVFKAKNNPSFLHIIMPVRVQDNQG